MNKANQKTENVIVRITPQDKAKLLLEAQMNMLTLSAHCRRKMLLNNE
jgi:hypothetical protein